MALEIADRVKETTTTTSTGTYTLAGAVDGFQSFAAVGNGNTTYYACTDGTDYEVGVGSYTASGTTLSRVTILESSNSDAAVNWGAGTKEIFVTVPAEKYLVRDASGNVSLTGNLTISGTVDGRDISVDGSKLDGIESGATADQTAAEIRSLVESATDSNVFTDADHTKLNGIESGATADQTITAGSGLTGGGTGNVTISHSDTSTQSSVNNSGRTYIQDITLDGFGHVTGIASATETVTAPTVNNATITISAGTDLTTGGNFTTNQGTNETITINHADTSTLSGTYGSTADGTKIDQITVDARGHVTAITTGATGDIQGVTAGSGLTGGGTSGTVTISHADTSSQASVNNSGRTYIQDITLDTYGHITGITSATETVTNTNTNQLTTFQVEDGDGTEVTISHAKEWKFVEGQGIDVNWTDTSNGSDGDPYDLTFALKANGVRANELNVSGNGTTSQFLRSDGDGSFTWATPTDTNTTYSAGTNLSLSGTTFNVSSNPSFTDVYVDDQILSTGDTNTYLQFHAADQWRVVVGGTERLEVKNSSPHVLVTGDLNSTSDARLKQNVEPIANALSDITQLEGVSFDWKDTGTRGHGFIAQQVEPILPDVVQTDAETGIKSINYVGMIGHLVEAIKELKAEIDELKR